MILPPPERHGFVFALIAVGTQVGFFLHFLQKPPCGVGQAKPRVCDGPKVSQPASMVDVGIQT